MLVGKKGQCNGCGKTTKQMVFRGDGKHTYACRDCQKEAGIHAANGFHGIVSKPTHFLVGEAGPERVSVTPIRKHNHRNRKQSKTFFDLMDTKNW